MPKCKNCGREFEGNFCPDCGENAGGASAPSKQTVVGRITSANSKIYAALGFVPAVLLALFAVLAFIFFCTPVAVMDLQELGSQSLGNAYSVFKTASRGGEELEELTGLSAIPGMKTVIIVAIVFAAVAAVYAVLALVFTLNRYHRNVGVKLANGVNFSTSRLISLAGAVFYIALAVIGGVMFSKASPSDESEMFKAGACPALLIAFGAVFALLTVAEEVARTFLIRKCPDCKNDEDEYLALVDEYAKSLPEPQKPEIPENLQRGNSDGDVLREKLKRSGMQTVAISVYCFIAAVAVIVVSVVMRLGTMFMSVFCVAATVCIAVGGVMIKSKKSRFALAQSRYERHVKQFEKGKNYKGSKGFNEWLSRGRNQTAE